MELNLFVGLSNEYVVKKLKLGAYVTFQKENNFSAQLELTTG